MYKSIDEIKMAISKMDDVAAENFLNTEIKKVSSQLDIVLSKGKKLIAEKERLLQENKSLKAENLKLKKSLEILELSRADKVELQQRLDEAEKEIEKLAIDLYKAEKDIEKYITDLKGRCKKLSVQIHGFGVDLTLLEKEISALNVFELQQMIMALEKQLRQKVPIGRKTGITAIGLKSEAKSENRDFCKFGKEKK
jgi:predicted RNase H-like nuclease (RuvC/YqgF family)